MNKTHKLLSESQVSIIKKLRLKQSPAPFCHGFLFIDGLSFKYKDATELYERGLLTITDNDMFKLTDDGIKLGNQFLKIKQ